tara:strand:- start:420 stop:761 length:342 start_codon:yes stop_codon:yes gene_type:complete
MFLDLDVVDFSDNEVPFINVVVNASLVRQVQRIDSGVQDSYNRGREEAKERQLDDPNEKVSPITELPSQGAMIVMIAPHFGTYYTVTPFEQVKEQFLGLGRGEKITNDENKAT